VGPPETDGLLGAECTSLLAARRTAPHGTTAHGKDIAGPALPCTTLTAVDFRFSATSESAPRVGFDPRTAHETALRMRGDLAGRRRWALQALLVGFG
jgi:hypothetical protein